MGEKASPSVQQIADAGLQGTRLEPSAGASRITQLRREAMDVPERRVEIIQTLERYIAGSSGTRKAGAACRAITSIMAVSMLELLQGD